jgi:membrane-associated phospholipid phosphatase
MPVGTARLFPLWLWLLPAAIFVLGAPVWLHWYEPFTFLAINGWGAPVAAQVWAGLSLLGNGWGILGITAPLLVLAPRAMLSWLCAAPFVIIFARGGKFLIESPRPAMVVDNALIRIIGEPKHFVAMPSGHTMTAFAVVCAIYFSIPKPQRLHYAWLWLVAAGVGISRITVGAHWPGDVVVGMSLGLLSGMLGSVLVQRIPPAHFASSSWVMRSVALLVAMSVYHLIFEELGFVENMPLQMLLAVVTVASLGAFVWRNVRALREPLI